MPNILRYTSTNSNIRLQLIGTIVSAIAYGFIISLSIHCLALLISNKRHAYTHTTRSVLISYVVVMFSLSTGSVIQAFAYIARAMFDGIDSTSHDLIKINLPVFLPPAILGADGFLLWRCIVLFRNSSQRLLVYCFLLPSSLGCLVFLVIYYLTPHFSTFGFHSPLTPSVVTVSITTSTNFIRASMITGRLLHHQETMRKIMGKQYGSPYLRVIVMVVESCCLTIVTGVVYLILVRGADVNNLGGGIIPLLVLPHVCVASSLLIVYQVARGRTFTSLSPSDIVTPNIAGMHEDCSRPIEFRCPPTTISNSDNIASNTSSDESELEPKPQNKSGKSLDRPYSRSSDTLQM